MTEVSVILALVITNDVPAVFVVTATGVATLTVPKDCTVSIIILFAVTAVVFTVTVPADKVAVPALAFDPVFILIRLPAVPKIRLPLIVVVPLSSTSNLSVPSEASIKSACPVVVPKLLT